MLIVKWKLCLAGAAWYNKLNPLSKTKELAQDGPVVQDDLGLK